MFMSEEQFEAECLARNERSLTAPLAELARLSAVLAEQDELAACLARFEARLARLAAGIDGLEA